MVKYYNVALNLQVKESLKTHFVTPSQFITTSIHIALVNINKLEDSMLMDYMWQINRKPYCIVGLLPHPPNFEHWHSSKVPWVTNWTQKVWCHNLSPDWTDWLNQNWTKSLHLKLGWKGDWFIMLLKRTSRKTWM